MRWTSLRPFVRPSVPTVVKLALGGFCSTPGGPFLFLPGSVFYFFAARRGRKRIVVPLPACADEREEQGGKERNLSPPRGRIYEQFPAAKRGKKKKKKKRNEGEFVQSRFFMSSIFFFSFLLSPFFVCASTCEKSLQVLLLRRPRFNPFFSLLLQGQYFIGRREERETRPRNQVLFG